MALPSTHETIQTDTRQNTGHYERVHWAPGRVVTDGISYNYNVSIPENLISPNLVVIVPGLGGFMGSSVPLSEALADEGYASLRYSPVRKDQEAYIETLKRPQALHVRTLETVIDDARQNSIVKKKLPNPGVMREQLVLAPHSMGGQAAVPVVLRRPEEVKNVTFLATGGLGTPTLASLLKSVPSQAPWALRHELFPALFRSPDRLAKNIGGILLHCLENPIRTLGETKSCIGNDLREGAEEIAELDINTAYVAFEHDIFVRPSPEIAEYVTRYRLLEELGHFAPQIHPREVAETIISLQNDLEAQPAQDNFLRAA